MRPARRYVKLVAVIFAFVLIVGACGSDDDDGGSSGGSSNRAAGDSETLVDLQNFAGGEPNHIDPALADTQQGAQVPWLMYQRLTDTDVEGSVVAAAAEENWTINEDATQFVFTLKEGLKFSSGEDVTPTSFKRAWERALDPALASTLTYHLTPIKGAADIEDGKTKELTGVVADDAARTLTVTLDKPFADFAAVVSHTVFSPLPKEALDAADPKQWEQGVMIGNGWYTMEKAWEHNKQVELVLNEQFNGGTPAKIKNLQFVISKDADSQYSAFRSGKGDTALIPPGKFKDATDRYPKNLTEPVLTVYKFEFGQDDPDLGGDKNEKLRQAISLGIDRDRINEQIYNAARQVATGLTPPGIPGYEEGLCQYCRYDVDEAKKLIADWGGDVSTLDIKIGTNTGSGHEPVIAIIVENLQALGIKASLDPLSPDTWTDDLRKAGGCHLCRSAWSWDYPVYDNVLSSQYLSSGVDGDNWARFESPEFDRMIDDARATKDQGEREGKYRATEKLLLDKMITMPINWYRGQVIEADRVEDLKMTPLNFVTYEQATLN